MGCWRDVWSKGSASPPTSSVTGPREALCLRSCRRARSRQPGSGGRVLPDESPEQVVRREVAEEAGLAEVAIVGPLRWTAGLVKIAASHGARRSSGSPPAPTDLGGSATLMPP
ncbi:NUDIX hydrolase [Nonomuraea sp. NPDC005692]|uniref:NUDIX hydrolase n=1 Tax=Nonomuraea sp. NPDC005692 TaxID=3157168 RepID=UPI0033FC033D